MGVTRPRRAAQATDDAVGPLVPRPPSSRCEVCVIIPVRDEAETLEAALDALAHQVDVQGHRLERARYEIVVLANNCRDDSAGVARRFAVRDPTLALHVVELALPPSRDHVGHARRLLMDEAYHRLRSLGRPRGVIASTDGDTRVAPDWIAATLAEVARGVDAVGGRIALEPAGRAALELAARAYHLRDVGYRHLVSEWATYLDPEPWDPWPRHHQHFGASLAVTAEAYGRAGGLPAVPALEDVALYQALLRVDARVRHSPAVRVATSARRSSQT
ncbi:MAG: glycosyltransferase family 2 protein, partial [Chloroflexi bacterium]|nr:glycosyltransferase family 2 protein [Chloroflexota bacterium]